MDAYLWGVAGFATYALLRSVVGFFKKKYSIKDEDKESIDDMKKICETRCAVTDKHFVSLDESVHMINDALPVILSGVYALLVTADEGKSNGEVGRARKEFTDTFKQKFSIK